MRRLSLVILALAACVIVVASAPSEEIKSSWVTYKSGEATVKAYLAEPAKEGKHPALIVIHEWWGLNEWIKEKTEDLAWQGYVALAIDLYRGHVAGSAEEAHELMRGVPEDRAARDLKAADAYLKSLKNVVRNRIGSVGWCMGGGYSLAAALNIKSLAATVVCYGRLVTEKEEVRKIPCPVLGIFGAEDRGIPPVSVMDFEKAAKAQDKNVSTVVYARAGHAFMNPNNKVGYRDSAATDAWNKIISFLDATLKK